MGSDQKLKKAAIAGTERTTRASAVDKAAATLRELAVASVDGDFLGSEEDMIQRLSVSRPTLRQASAQVAQENLISIRRGVGGGYFSRRPDSLSVSRIASLYLQSRASGLDDISHAIKPIRMEIALLASRNRNPDMREALRSFVEQERAHEDDSSYRAFLRSERVFGRLLGAMSGNAILNLFLDILYDLASHLQRDEDVLVNRPERVKTFRKLRNQMARAILDADEEIATIATNRCSEMISAWMAEDQSGRSFVDCVIDGTAKQQSA